MLHSPVCIIMAYLLLYSPQIAVRFSLALWTLSIPRRTSTQLLRKDSLTLKTTKRSNSNQQFKVYARTPTLFQKLRVTHIIWHNGGGWVICKKREGENFWKHLSNSNLISMFLWISDGPCTCTNPNGYRFYSNLCPYWSETHTRGSKNYGFSTVFF